MSNFKDTTEPGTIRPQTVILKSCRHPRRVSFPMDVDGPSVIPMPTIPLLPLSKISEPSFNNKNMGCEYNFSKHQLTRHKSDNSYLKNGLQKDLKMHHGDQNISESSPHVELSSKLCNGSLNERIFRVEVSSPNHSEMPSDCGDIQPLLRPRSLSQSDKGGIDQKIQSVQHRLTLAKLAMMRKKLEPLPNRQRLCSDMGSSFDSSIRDLY